MAAEGDSPENPLPEPGHDIIVVGASAGGVEALRALVAGLPADLAAAVLVVLHVPRNAPSALPAILGRAGPLPAAHALDGEHMRYGRIYVAPADHHLLVLDGRIRLTRGPVENGHRPAIDPLFRSAARGYGERTVGVVLSGSRDDGAAGLVAVAERGGVTIVQDPAEALYPSMPSAAIAQTRVQHVLPAAKIGSLLGELSRRSVDPVDAPDDPVLDAEVEMAEAKPITTDQIAVPSGFACPSCGGALFEIGGAVPRYRCRIGHAWSPETLLDEQSQAVEGALWVALRALEERAALAERMADNAAKRDGRTSTRRYRAMSEEATRASTLIRDLIRRIGEAGGNGNEGAE